MLPAKSLEKLNGLLFIAALASISCLIALWTQHIGIGPMVVAIVLGIITGNVWRHPASWTPGIQFSAKRILRIAIILYGFRISFQQITAVGASALLLDVIVVISTLFIGYFIGRNVLKLDRDLSLLVSAGAAICGAAAVLAVEDILKSEPYKTSVAIGTVVLFGTLSMFVYPLLQQQGWLGLTDNQFGLFAGASIHEVAQVLVAGTDISPVTGETGVIVKMIRVLLLIPVLIFLSAWISWDKKSGRKKIQVVVPWFALGFLAVIAFNSLNLLSFEVVRNINQLDIVLLTMAMGAIGFETKWAKIKSVGIKPLYLASLLFLWLMTSVLILVKTLVY